MVAIPAVWILDRPALFCEAARIDRAGHRPDVPADLAGAVVQDRDLLPGADRGACVRPPRYSEAAACARKQPRRVHVNSSRTARSPAACPGRDAEDALEPGLRVGRP